MKIDFGAVEQGAVNSAVRAAASIRWHPSITRDDMRQIASLAILEALPRIDRSRPQHEQAAWLARRALGAILDDVRRASGRGRGYGREVCDGSAGTHESAHVDTPEGMLSARRALARIAGLPEPLPTIVAMSADGEANKDIARHLGVTPSRITQLFDKVRKALAR